MKKIIVLTVLILASCSSKKEIQQVVEVACGQCQLELKEPQGCDLAVRIEGTSYFVDGFGIDDFGDAHDTETGFCEVIRKATVKGNIEHGRFFASSIELIE